MNPEIWTIIGTSLAACTFLYTVIRNFKTDIKSDIKELKSDVKELRTSLNRF